jgi:hypothetical protein
MATIVTRAGKGSPLTHNEVDSNFTNLNTDKVELTGTSPVSISVTTAGNALSVTQSGAGNAINASGTIVATAFSGPINGAVGGSTPAAGAFTTLSASSTVSGTGFSTYLASPPAIGSTAANTGAFTTLSASSTVSGTGFSTYLASPPAIGGTAPAAGSFTNLNATGVSVFNGAIASAVAGAEVSLIGTLPTTGSSVAYGLWSDVTMPSNATGASFGISSRVSTAAASFTAGSMAAYAANFTTLGASSSITNLYGFFAQTGLTVATSVNAGFFSNLAASAALRWNFYASGTAPNYFAGPTGVGATTTIDPLRIGGTPSGSTTINGIIVDPTIGSGVTGNFRGVLSRPVTQAATFTLSNLVHFYVNPQTKGAGSTITNQYGFLAESTITDGTNNFGFYSNIASASQRWNFYAVGTAANYFAGDTGIGTIPTSGKITLGGTSPVSGGNGQGILANTSAPTTLTGQFVNFYSYPTSAASATINQLFHFYANTAPLGAGTTVTQQFGLAVESTLTGATTNYGVYSGIAAAASRWNFYAAGTAQNYFAGNTFIGAITGDQALNVNGAVRVAAATSANQTSAGTTDFGSGSMRFLSWGASGTQGTFSWFTGTGGASAALRMTLDGSGNLGLATSTFGTSATNTFAVFTGTAPTTGPADTVQFYSTDLSAGNTIPSYYTEGTNVGTGTPTANRTIAVRFNGTVYYLLASTIP